MPVLSCCVPRLCARSLAASMLVTIVLDLWRISVGAITGPGSPNKLPWM